MDSAYIHHGIQCTNLGTIFSHLWEPDNLYLSYISLLYTYRILFLFGGIFHVTRELYVNLSTLYEEFVFKTFISWLVTHITAYSYFMREYFMYFLYVYFYGTELKFSHDTKFYTIPSFFCLLLQSTLEDFNEYLYEYGLTYIYFIIY